MEEPVILVVVIAGVILLVGGILVASRFYEKKRRQDLKIAAEELGLTFLPEGDANVLANLSGFGLFKQGRSRKMTNLISGTTDEVQIAIFDYRYVTGSGKHQTTHNQTVASLQSNLLKVPSFTMRPEGFFDKIGGALGLQDIDFESHPTFSQMFVLKSENEEHVRKFFGPQVLEFFESQPGVSVEAQTGALIFYRPRKKVKAEELKELLSAAYGVFGVMVDQEKTD